MRKAILVPIKCDCGTILDYMDINQVPEKIHSRFKKGEAVVLQCNNCGGGTRFIITQAQFDKVIGK